LALLVGLAARMQARRYIAMTIATSTELQIYRHYRTLMKC